VAGLFVGQTADAGFTFQTRYRINGGAWTVVTDGDAADTNPLVGRITININGGLIVDSALSNAQSGNQFLGSLDLSVDGNLTAGDTLDVQAFDINFNLTPPSGSDYGYNFNFTGTWPGGTATSTAYLDTSNTQFGTPAPPYEFGPLGFGGQTSGAVAGTS